MSNWGRSKGLCYLGCHRYSGLSWLPFFSGQMKCGFSEEIRIMWIQFLPRPACYKLDYTTKGMAYAIFSGHAELCQSGWKYQDFLYAISLPLFWRGGENKSLYVKVTQRSIQIAGSMGQYGAHLGPIGPRWAHVGPMDLAIWGGMPNTRGAALFR